MLQVSGNAVKPMALKAVSSIAKVVIMIKDYDDDDGNADADDSVSVSQKISEWVSKKFGLGNGLKKLSKKVFYLSG